MDNNIKNEVYQLIEQSKYQEALQLVLESPLSDMEKHNLSEFIKSAKKVHHPRAIPKVPIVSMILGFVLFIGAMFLPEENIRYVLMTLGVALAIIPPVIYGLHEKYLTDREDDPRAKTAAIYGEVGANANFPFVMPSASIVILTVIGILLLGFSVVLLLLNGHVLNFICFLLGFATLFLVQIKLKNHNGKFYCGFLLIEFLLIGLVVCFLNPGVYNDTLVNILMVIALVFYALMPLFYKISIQNACTETVTAKCIDVIKVKSRKSFSFITYYAVVWMYSYNGVTYIHKDNACAKFSYPKDLYELTISIDPKAPHTIYTGKFPTLLWCFYLHGLLLGMPLTAAMLGILG